MITEVKHIELNQFSVGRKPCEERSSIACIPPWSYVTDTRYAGGGIDRRRITWSSSTLGPLDAGNWVQDLETGCPPTRYRWADSGLKRKEKDTKVMLETCCPGLSLLFFKSRA